MASAIGAGSTSCGAAAATASAARYERTPGSVASSSARSERELWGVGGTAKASLASGAAATALSGRKSSSSTFPGDNVARLPVSGGRGEVSASAAGAVASNAAVGGPTTAAAMATAKGWDDLVLPALLVGILGYATGTFVSIGLLAWVR